MGFSLYVRVPALVTPPQCRIVTEKLLVEFPEMLSAEMTPQEHPLNDRTHDTLLIHRARCGGPSISHLF